MRKINKQELRLIIGGKGISGSVVNAVISAGKFIYSMGQSLGGSIRRIGSKNLCKI